MIAALLLWPFEAPLKLKPLFSPRVSWGIPVCSALAIPALLTLVRLFLPIGVGVHDFIIKIPQCFLVMAILLPIVLGEELGWRGYLLPSLLKQYSFGISSIAVGIIWSLWHLPLFFSGYIPVLFDNLPLTFSLYTLQTTCCSILIAWLFLAGNRRIWIPCLVHASNNAFTGATPSAFSDFEKLQVWSAVILIALLFCTWILWRNRNPTPHLGSPK
jgi:membrane protease YdiL (CAAX protease family)